jgi:plasmid stabilization system protein ParE
MPLRLEISTRAQADLFAIVRFIAESNRDYADAERFGDKLLERCASIIAAPGAGAPHQRNEGVRKLVEGNYKIFYRLDEECIRILRIWDGRRGTEPRV